MLIYGGLLYPAPFTDEGQIWYAIYAYLPNFISIGLFCMSHSGGGKPQILPFFGLRRFVVSLIGSMQRKLNSTCQKPQILPFWNSAFCGVANWQHMENVERGCTTTNLPQSNGIKIVSVHQRLHGEIMCTNFVHQKRDGHTRTKKLNVFGCPGGGWNPSPTKLGIVTEDLEHVFAFLKRLGSDVQFRR